MLEALRDFIRPIAVAALIAMLLIGAAVAGALEALFPGSGIAFTNGVAGWFRAIPGDFYNLALAALLGYAGARTVEKAVATHATAKYDQPTRSNVDDPDAPRTMPHPTYGKDRR
ncbi:hypothetical protein [Aurantiacibacter spongiae]|uniref:Uncharacterized protein n=1 Tax=Aurantiacibacter spongiae TaxID=2488860 RepID=A0A3N5DIH5_9SPHN|nr:hypothetical protein [Aurantiacibacter spongiae]RPF70435.1 hypothetical protein EG799_01425 [Aurantiacibacter spongiae]